MFIYIMTDNMKISYESTKVYFRIIMKYGNICRIMRGGGCGRLCQAQTKKFYIFYKVNAFGDYCEDNLSNYAAMKSFMLNG